MDTRTRALKYAERLSNSVKGLKYLVWDGKTFLPNLPPKESTENFILARRRAMQEEVKMESIWPFIAYIITPAAESDMLRDEIWIKGKAIHKAMCTAQGILTDNMGFDFSMSGREREAERDRWNTSFEIIVDSIRKALDEIRIVDYETV